MKCACGYSELQTFSIQNSLGISASASYGGASGSLSLDLNSLDQSVDESTNIGESLTKFTIGSKGVPLPISTELVPITEALEDVFWDADEMTEISQKRTNLEKALTDYPDNKGAYVDAGKLIYIVCTITYYNCIIHACTLQYNVQIKGT